MSHRLRSWLAEVGPFLLAAALWLAPLLRDPAGFLYWRGGAYSDVAISHWPDAFFIRRAIEGWGQIPLWNPTILGGAPLAADPLTGFWYLPAWLAILLPPSLGFNLLLWLHLAWAGWGTSRLMRMEDVGRGGAILAGLAFSGMPMLVGHAGLGHVLFVCAVAWTPWVLLAVSRAVDAATGGGRGWAFGAGRAGAVLGVVFLADPRWALPVGLMGVAWGVRRLAHSQTKGAGGIRRLASAAAVAAAFTACVAGGLALPLLEFVGLSTRASLTPADQTAFSLPAGRLLGLLSPDLGGWPEWTTYVGVAVLVLGTVAVAVRPSRSLFWVSVAVVAGMLALGSATPVYMWIGGIIPGFDLLRVPARFMLLAGFAVACLAGVGLDLLAGSSLPRRDARRARLAAFTTAALALAVSAMLAFYSRQPAAEASTRSTFAGVVTLVALSLFWALVSLSPWLGAPLKSAGWVLLILIDLGWVNLAQLEVRPKTMVLGEGAELGRTISSDGGQKRIFSPSYSLPQQTAALYGLELADGINPLQLASYRDRLSEATGFSTANYSVTLPPFPSGDPSIPWGVRIDPRSLGLLAVGTVVSDYPLDGQGLMAMGRIAGAWVYRNPEVRPRAWLEPVGAGGSTWVSVDRVEWSPDRISVEAEGPGLLVLSENAYPGWTVTVDGRPSILLTVHGSLRGVDLPDGSHEVVFAFRPRTVYLGAVLVLASAIALLVLWRVR